MNRAFRFERRNEVRDTGRVGRAMDKKMLFQELWISLRQIKDEPIESTEISVLLTILMVCKRVIQ